jgi:hypothetical protein
MTTSKDELADLKREVAQLKRDAQPTDWAAMERAAAEWRNQMHQQSEARMSRAGNFSREDLRKFEEATPAETCRDLREHGVVQSPSGAGVSGTITSVSRNPGLGTGWQPSTPLGPSMHQRYVDQLLDHADAQDRAELMQKGQGGGNAR